jgi:hypothetical protein
MRIPNNSTFTKEISKKFKRIFNPQTTLGEIKNLQGVSIMGTHVDNFLNEVQNKDSKNAQSYKTARAIRQEHSYGKEVVGQAISSKTQKQRNCVETTSS